MQIVIDISEEEYNLIKMKSYIKIGGVLSQAEWLIIKGTPLPKGHGRLISTNDLDITKLVDSDIEWVMGICDISRVQDMIDNAPTIIEADKENE